MQVRNVLLLLGISIAPSVEAVHTIRGLRTDDSTKMKMSHKSHKMAKKSSKSFKGATASSEEDDCPGLSDGSSESPYGNSTSESPDGNRRVQESVDTEIVFDNLPYTVSRVDVTQVSYAVGAGRPYGGVINYFPGGNKAYIKFRIVRDSNACVANWFSEGLSDGNMLSLLDVEDRRGHRETRPEIMSFAAVLNIVITFENNQQIRFENFRVGESRIWSRPLMYSKLTWWIGSDYCVKNDDSSMYCRDTEAGKGWTLRRDRGNTIYFS